MARLNFHRLFRTNVDGSFEPLERIRIAGVDIGPGVRFRRGVLFAGIDFTLFVDKDFEVERNIEGVYVISGIYQ